LGQWEHSLQEARFFPYALSLVAYWLTTDSVYRLRRVLNPKSLLLALATYSSLQFYSRSLTTEHGLCFLLIPYTAVL